METLTKPSPSARAVTVLGAAAARFCLACAAAAVALLAILHLLRPDLDPSWRMISEYALGDHGWLMRIAFLAWGLSSIGLFAALRRQPRNLVGRIGLGFLLLGAAGPLLAGLFPMEPLGTPAEAATVSGNIHSLGAVLGDALPVAATLLTIGLLRGNPGWKATRGALVGATILAWAGFLVLGVSMAILLPRHGGQLGPEVLVGWQSRFTMVAYLAWPAAAAWCALRRRSSPDALLA